MGPFKLESGKALDGTTYKTWTYYLHDKKLSSISNWTVTLRIPNAHIKYNMLYWYAM